MRHKVIWSFLSLLFVGSSFCSLLDEGMVLSQKRPGSPTKHLPEEAKKAREEASSASPLDPSPVEKKSSFFAKRFTEIQQKQQASEHLAGLFMGITLADEESRGSRRWVDGFDADRKSDIHTWHLKSAEAILKMRKINSEKKYLGETVNFALARLTFVLSDGTKEHRKLPYFFMSKFPGKEDNKGAQEFSKHLPKREIGEFYKEYGLKFIGKSYKEGKDEGKETGTNFREDLGTVLERYLELEEIMVGKERIRYHLSRLDENKITAKLYFHSEQSLRPCVKKAIEEFLKNFKMKKMFFPKRELNYVELDICSSNDMCWCCGDTLVSCCQLEDLGAKVIVRASGCNRYKDLHTTENRSLRDDKERFAGFSERRGYEIDLTATPPLYRPYISHATLESLK